MYRILPAGTTSPPPQCANALSEQQLATARRRTLARGETICEPGLPEVVGYVVSGVVKLVTFSPDGRTNIVAVIEAPGFFGRVFGISAEFTIEAATDVVLACFDRASFEEQLSKNPALEHLIHMENLHQLDEAQERITVLACQSMIERMAMYMVLRLLAAEARSGSRASAPPSIHIPLNRRDFAAYLGTTVETVSRNIQALVRRGTIEVLDSANFRLLRRRDLFAIAGQDEEDLFEVVRSRARALPAGPAFLRPAAMPRPMHADSIAHHMVAAE